MNKLPHHNNPMYVGNGAPPAASSAAPHPGHADALPNDRLAAAAGGMDPLSLQHEMMRRHQQDRNDALAAPSSRLAAPAAARRDDDDDHAALLARRVEELACLNGEYQRIVLAEIAAREMRDRVAASEEARRERREEARTTRNREAFCDALREQREARRGEADEDEAAAGRRAGRPGDPFGGAFGNAPAGDAPAGVLGNAHPGHPSGEAFGRGVCPAKFGERSGGAFGDHFLNGSVGNSFSNLTHASGDPSSGMVHPSGGMVHPSGGMVHPSNGAFGGALRHRFLDGAASDPMAGSLGPANKEMTLCERIQWSMMEEGAMRNQQRQMHWAAVTGQQIPMGPSSGETKQPTGHGNGEQLARMLQLQQMTNQEQVTMAGLHHQQLQQAATGSVRGWGESQPSAPGAQERLATLTGQQNGMGPSSGEKQRIGHGNQEQLAPQLQLQQMTNQEQAAMAGHHQHQQVTTGSVRGWGESQPSAPGAQERLATLTGQQNGMGPSSGEKQRIGHGNQEQLARMLQLQQMTNQEQAAMAGLHHQQHQQATTGSVRGRGENQPSAPGAQERLATLTGQQNGMGPSSGENQRIGHGNQEQLAPQLQLQQMTNQEQLAMVGHHQHQQVTTGSVRGWGESQPSAPAAQERLATLTGQQNGMGPSSGEKQRIGHGNQEQLARLLQLQQMTNQEQVAMAGRNQHQHQQATIVPASGQGESGPSPSDNIEDGGPGEHQPSVSREGEQPTGHGNQEHLDRLLQLQRMSDDDLLRRAANVQNSHSSAPRDSPERDDDEGSSTERQPDGMDSRLLRRGLSGGISQFRGASRADQDPRRDLDMMDQAQANAAAARGFSNISEKPAAADRANSMQQQRQHSTVQPHGQRKLSSVSEAGQAGRRSQMNPTQHSTSLQDDSKPLRYFNNGIEVDAVGNPPQTKNGVAPAPASVPTNANIAPSPALAGAASPDNDIIAKFLTMVVSRVPEIAPAVADLLPDGGDPVLLKSAFPTVVDATLAELRSIRERLGGAGNASDFHLIQRVTYCISAIETCKVDLGAAGGPVPPPRPARPAMPTAGNGPALAASAGTFPNDGTGFDRPAPVPGPRRFPPPEEPAMARQAHQHRAITMQNAHWAQTFELDTAKEAEFASLGDGKDKAESRAVGEDLPLIAAYKTKKKEEAEKRKKAAASKKRKKNGNSKIARRAACPGASSAAREAVPGEGGKARRDGAPAEEEGSPKSRPAKKRRVSGRAPPHGEQLHRLFGEPSGADPELEGDVARQGSANSVVTEGSEDRRARPANRDEEDGHYDAASVLLGLMGR